MAEEQNTGRIYRRVLTAFVGVILTLVAFTVVLQLLAGYIIGQNEVILTNLINESLFVNGVPALTGGYYSLALTNAQSRERLNAYTELKTSLLSTIGQLDKSIVDPQSRAKYLGVRNLVLSVIQDCEDGIKAALLGNIVSASKYYDNALSKSRFVNEDTVNLIISEMDYAQGLNQRLVQIRAVSTYFMVVVGLLIILGTIIYVRQFSKKLSAPLIAIAVAARKIESEDFDYVIPPEVLNRNDEIGVLGKAFSNMEKRLKYNILELRESNKVAIESKAVLEDKNSDLEKINNLVIGRELKMIEMKKEIEELKRQLQEK